MLVYVSVESINLLFVTHFSAAATPAGVVRVLNLKTGERLLVKGFRGQIRDMAFARLATTVMLAIVDEFGTLCVYEVHENTSTLLMKVTSIFLFSSCVVLLAELYGKALKELG